MSDSDVITRAFLEGPAGQSTAQAVVEFDNGNYLCVAGGTIVLYNCNDEALDEVTIEHESGELNSNPLSYRDAIRLTKNHLR